MADEMKYIVAIRPGSSVEVPVRAPIALEQLDMTFEKLVGYVVGLNQNRQAARTAEAIKTEMTGQYGITVNGKAVEKTDVIKQYFVEATARDTKYMSAEIIVASKQTGGNLESML